MSVIDDGGWAGVEVCDGGTRGVDSEVVVDRGEEIAGSQRLSTTSSPRLSVAPITRPVWMPPPAQMFEKARVQWPRPGWTVPAAALASPAPVLGEYLRLKCSVQCPNWCFQIWSLHRIS